MVVRWSERDWGSDVDDTTSIFDHDDLWESRLHAEGLLDPTKLRQFGRAQRLRDTAIFHPAITTFGASSLVDFLQGEIEKAVADGRLGKGKGKESARSESRDQDDGTTQQKRRATDDQDDDLVQQPAAPASLTLAKDALLHLRGLKSKEEVSHASSPALPQMSLSTASSHNNNIPVRSLDADELRRSQALSDGRLRRPNSRMTDRLSDFAQHTQQVRDRARSEQLASPLRRVVNVTASGDNAPMGVSAPNPGHTSRRRRIHIPASSPQPLNSDDDDADLYPVVALPGLENSTSAQSLFSPSDEVAQQHQAAPDTSSHLVPSDDDEGIEDLNSLFGMVATDSDSEPVDGGEADNVDPFQDDLQPRDFGSRRSKAKRTARDWSSEAFDLPSAESSPSNPSRIKSFPYTAVVAAEKPKIVQRRGPTDDTDIADSTPASPRRPVTSPSNRGRIRRIAPTPVYVNTNPVSDENTQPAQTGKALSRDKVKFVITNDANDRTWDPHYPPCSDLAPPTCPADPDAPPRNMPSSQATVLPFNYDIWNDVVGYLSLEDLRKLRLTCRGFADEISPLMLRSVVTTFGTSMFSNIPELSNSNNTSLANSMLAKYGHEIHKFGISFEYDPFGLMYAKPKVTEKKEYAWYGSYQWPLETYPRYVDLQELEDLVDNNRPLLKDSLGMLKGASELGLSLDSGHGWLDGPDISDLALFELRRKQSSKIFGESFQEDIWDAFARSEWFKWGQQNSINASLLAIASRPDTTANRRLINDLKKMVVREYESFIDEQSQHDFDPFSHTGGQALQSPPQHVQQQNGGIPQPPGGLQQPLAAIQQQQAAGVQQQAVVHHQHGAYQALLQQHAAMQQQQAPPAQPQGGMFQRLRPATLRQRNGDGGNQSTKSGSPRQIPLQWPTIFNGYDLAADVGGRNLWIQNKVANPANFPVIPGHLTEAQVQWLMETVWAQRAFLSAYTTAVITHKQTLSKVHTMTIAKISSGLLPSLAQKEFWASLSELKHLKILVSPDWRNEHVPGDKFFATHMKTSPVLAASKFAEFLRRYIAKLEGLSHLTVGYIGGGENATGMFARNQHLLPAPITEEPRLWITDHVKQPDPATLFTFKHIKELTFENCWFSPCMLETFMEKSRDASLHSLTLDSVSMLGRNATGIDGGLSTLKNGLLCEWDETDWLHEELPSSATWTDVLDKITPDITMKERKYAAGMKVDKDLDPAPTKDFRGNVQKIILKSCGYAKITGVKGDEYNQNGLVVQSYVAMDGGLQSRKRLFDKWNGHVGVSDDDDHNNGPGFWVPAYGLGGGRARTKIPKDLPVMISMNDPATGMEWFGLGTLTQCVHPIEKRILEKAWGMSFGWGNDIERWAAVDDGWFEGGTGRFSGVIEKKECKDGDVQSV